MTFDKRPLPDEEDLGRYNPETFVAFHLIAPDDFEPNKVQVTNSIERNFNL